MILKIGCSVSLRTTLMWLVVTCNVYLLSEAIRITLPPIGTKCVSEEIQTNIVVLADYHLIHDDNATNIATISVKVTSPFGDDLYHRENVSYGHFAFTTHETGSFLACFTSDNSMNPEGVLLSLNLNWKIGIAAKDWESIAKKENLEGVQLDLRKLGGVVEAIHENLLYLKSREAEMRGVSETTNGRVAWLSLLSLAICIVASTLQLVYLKRYFMKKKLI